VNSRNNSNTKIAIHLPSFSRKEVLILEMLLDGRELYGLELVNASNGNLKRGTVYVTLQRLQESGMVTSRQEPRSAPEIGIPRRLYKITGYGERAFQGYQKAIWAFEAELLPAELG
jgi:DNA-binding PadR family transcriptional regulator